MNESTLIVTGGYGGVGAACVDALVRRGHHVIVAGRDLDKARDVAARSGGRARAMALDLGSFSSIRRFASEMRENAGPPLRGLVLNAGVMALESVRTTEDGLEMNFGVNHVGHFLLTTLLLERLTEPARIVAVSSSGHDPKTMAGRSGPPAWPGAEALARVESGAAARMAPLSRYTTSKLCNVLFAYELSRRMRRAGRQITANAFDPGVVLGTTLGRELGVMNRVLTSQAWLLRLLGARLVSPRDAGEDLAKLASDAAFEGVSGKYFEGARETPSSDASYDEALARELWEVSERLVRPQQPASVANA
ncbi:MAG: SDR family NAD(P)-dependent oxidoreductase [Myxococcales bacterium]|nr:SDR family NAD(P)-dependent oxidoreductase [Myxococcales bacterium]